MLRQATILAIFSVAAYSYGEVDFSMPWGWGNAASAIVSVGFTLPIMIFSPLSGQIADRVDRDVLVRKLKYIELCLMAYASLCFAIGNGPQLIFALFLMGTQSAFFSPVRTSLMPQYYRPDELAMANGIFNAILFVAIVAGLGIGGALIITEGGRLMVSLILVIAAVLGALFATQCPKAPVSNSSPINWNIPLVAVKMFRQAARQDGILYPMLGIGWFWMINAATIAILPNVVRDTLQASDGVINACLAISAIGAGLGSMTAGFIINKFRDSLSFAGWAIALNSILWLAAWLVFPNHRIPEAGFFSFGNLPLILILLAAAMTLGMFVVPLMAILQHRAPNEIRAQIMGTSNMTNGAMATFIGIFVALVTLLLNPPPHHHLLFLAVLQAGLFAFMWRRKGAIREAAEPVTTNPLTEEVITPSFSESSK